MAQRQTPKAFLSARDLMQRIKKSKTTIRRWIESGEIPAHCYRQSGEYGPREFSLAAVVFYEASCRWPTEAEQRELYLQLMQAGMVPSPVLEVVASN